MITAEDVPGDNNYKGEVLFAQNEVRDLCEAYYSNTLLEMLRQINGCDYNIYGFIFTSRRLIENQ